MTLKNTDHLKDKKNLLACSAGTDSSALYHALKALNIDFDVVIVNYNTRANSCLEMTHTMDLCKLDNKFCYTSSVFITSTSNFEKEARDIRHLFFDNVIESFNYDNLITGHNLNDKMEWFLMQMTKGAGVRELFGMKPISQKIINAEKSYQVVRPLIDTSKDEILKYLKENKIKHFVDDSNENEKYTRNKFRKNYASQLVSEFASGISKTFNILEEEIENIEIEFMCQSEEFCEIKATDHNYDVMADILLKHCGYLMSSAQRLVIKEKKEIVVKMSYLGLDKRHYVLSYNKGSILLTPYVTNVVLNHEEKESFRKNGINPKHRQFLKKINYKN
jgi:tRNA(Ile)-lysidine synthase